MGLLEFVLCFLVSLSVVAWRRWRYGPLLPTWSFRYEWFTNAQKRFHRRVARRSPLSERRAWESLEARGSARSRVTQRAEELGGVPCRRYMPPSASGSYTSSPIERVVLYFHGGSFMYGSERSHGELVAELALACDAALVMPLYRLVPEHRHPAALQDALAVYRALLADGVQPGRLVLSGDSAGGNLALSLLLALRSAGLPMPAAVVPISPWVNLEEQTGSMQRNAVFDWAEPWMFERWAREYLGIEEMNSNHPWGKLRDPSVSPAYGDLRGLPPCLILVGSAEMLYDQVLAFAAKARASGVLTELREERDRVHLWLALRPMFPEFQSSFDAIGEFVKRHTRGAN